MHSASGVKVQYLKVWEKVRPEATAPRLGGFEKVGHADFELEMEWKWNGNGLGTECGWGCGILEVWGKARRSAAVSAGRASRVPPACIGAMPRRMDSLGCPVQVGACMLLAMLM